MLLCLNLCIIPVKNPFPLGCPIISAHVLCPCVCVHMCIYTHSFSIVISILEMFSNFSHSRNVFTGCKFTSLQINNFCFLLPIVCRGKRLTVPPAMFSTENLPKRVVCYKWTESAILTNFPEPTTALSMGCNEGAVTRVSKQLPQGFMHYGCIRTEKLVMRNSGIP